MAVDAEALDAAFDADPEAQAIVLLCHEYGYTPMEAGALTEDQITLLLAGLRWLNRSGPLRRSDLEEELHAKFRALGVV